jgi:hypothetical protein
MKLNSHANTLAAVKMNEALCKNEKKDVIPTYSIFQHVSIN